LEHACRNLNRWAEGDTFGPGDLASLEDWRRILDEANVGRLVENITDASDERQRLRSFLPFVGALSPEERMEILSTGYEGQS
jgi:hypothetical protein